MQFGVISEYEQNLKSYKKDPKAEAVVIFDIGKSIFFDTDRGGYNIRFTRKKRIKILDKTGIKFSEVSIPFFVDGYMVKQNILLPLRHIVTILKMADL